MNVKLSASDLLEIQRRWLKLRDIGDAPASRKLGNGYRIDRHGAIRKGKVVVLNAPKRDSVT
jgi:hypothetical protein